MHQRAGLHTAELHHKSPTSVTSDTSVTLTLTLTEGILHMALGHKTRLKCVGPARGIISDEWEVSL